MQRFGRKITVTPINERAIVLVALRLCALGYCNNTDRLTSFSYKKLRCSDSVLGPYDLFDVSW